ncbi:MAG: hypothetical protein U1F43_18980 [Myxococcota bacterium]
MHAVRTPTSGRASSLSGPLCSLALALALAPLSAACQDGYRRAARRPII